MHTEVIIDAVAMFIRKRKNKHMGYQSARDDDLIVEIYSTYPNFINISITNCRCRHRAIVGSSAKLEDVVNFIIDATLELDRKEDDDGLSISEQRALVYGYGW